MANNWEKSIALHGHACCLLAVGYRAAETALAELTRVGVDIGDLAAVVENRTCGVDAVQVVCRATPGNGRLLVLDRGKYVFTIGNPQSGRGVRIALKPGILSRPGSEFIRLMEKVANQEASEEERAKFYQLQEPLMRFLLEVPAEEIFHVTMVDFCFSRERLSFVTTTCGRCGEEVMEGHARRTPTGAVFCPSCCYFRFYLPS